MGLHFHCWEGGERCKELRIGKVGVAKLVSGDFFYYLKSLSTFRFFPIS